MMQKYAFYCISEQNCEIFIFLGYNLFENECIDVHSLCYLFACDRVIYGLSARRFFKNVRSTRKILPGFRIVCSVSAFL